MDRHEPDAEVIAHCLNGTPQAYRDLVERHAPELRAFIAARTGSAAGADDVAIETFTRAWMGLRSLKKRESFASWVRGIAIRVLREQRRGVVRAIDTEVQSEDLGPDAGLIGRVEALPEPYREAVRLRYFRGLTCAEIALREGAAVGTITKRLSRAHAMLRGAIAPNGEEVLNEL